MSFLPQNPYVIPLQKPTTLPDLTPNIIPLPKYPFDYAASEYGITKQFNPTKVRTQPLTKSHHTRTCTHVITTLTIPPPPPQLIIDLFCLVGLASEPKVRRHSLLSLLPPLRSAFPFSLLVASQIYTHLPHPCPYPLFPTYNR